MTDAIPYASFEDETKKKRKRKRGKTPSESTGAKESELQNPKEVCSLKPYLIIVNFVPCPDNSFPVKPAGYRSC